MREITSRHRLSIHTYTHTHIDIGREKKKRISHSSSQEEVYLYTKSKANLAFAILARFSSSRFQLQHAPQRRGLGFLTREPDAQVVALLLHARELGLELADAVDPLLAVLAGGLVVALTLVGRDLVDGGRGTFCCTVAAALFRQRRLWWWWCILRGWHGRNHK